MENEINLIDIIKILNKYKWFIFVVVFIAITFSYITASKAPKQYQASATILILDSSGGSLLPGLSFGGGSGSESKIKAILKSKVLAKSVINELNLLPVLFEKNQTIEDAAAFLSGNVDGATRKSDGVFEINVILYKPNFAVKVANTYVDKLGDFLNNRSLGVNFQKMDAAGPGEAFSVTPLKKNLMVAFFISLILGSVLSFIFDYLKNSWSEIKANL
ncbi:hypothetical protein A2310_07400 [candidate division WOR-1 bacterium RIFOXYB2_FULL_37_13]|uniref:Polysaccharide chain length determinant N-terminal domain-containing protein n=1 Tax=candidate division WOR-1 bacterium RIFOXYB2_FULL_37_13 TaxID=1802579 RepID=A0A1F4SSC4_UNCSA|nr:MAG: hypothetical protein A2310_07400 [candidate division WOR-1 bacterium RIFOXYB2_FULL_37_13]